MARRKKRNETGLCSTKLPGHDSALIAASSKGATTTRAQGGSRLAAFERPVLHPPKLSPVVRQDHRAAARVFKAAYVAEFLNLPDEHSEAGEEGIEEMNKRQEFVESITQITADYRSCEEYGKRILATVAPGLTAELSAEFSYTAWSKDGATKKGYEVNFTRNFYKLKPLRQQEEICAGILAIEKETEGLLSEIIIGGQT